MKRVVLVLSFCVAGVYLFCSNNSGVGFAGNKDRTGGPFSSGLTCGQCHSSSAMTTPTTTIQILDANSNPVTSYIPNDVYTMRITVNSPTGASYGCQALALINSNNTQAGSFTTQGPNTRVTTIGSRKYPEQSSRSASGVFTYNWTAPAEGSGDVTFYVCGNAVNNSNSAAGDKSSTITLTINENLNSIEQEELIQLKLYPNPSSEFIVLENIPLDIVIAEIYDLNGKKLFSSALNSQNKLIISLNDFTSGTFILQLKSETENISKLFIKH